MKTTEWGGAEKSPVKLKQEYTTKEVAEILGYHPVYMRALVGNGGMPSTKHLNGSRTISLDDLLEWARRKRWVSPDLLRLHLMANNDLF